MQVYLHDIPLPEAEARFQSALKLAGLWGLLGTEEITLDENALGRTLANPIWAKLSSPHYHSSAMDGFAVRASHTSGAMPNDPVTLTCNPKGDGRAAWYVDTGDPLPEWADAVIQIENIEALSDAGVVAVDLRHPAAIRIRAAVPPWHHVRPMGEDMVASQLILPAGHTLRPVDLGAAAACGHDSVWVSRQPHVAVLPTGSELIPVGQPIQIGQIIEYNSIVLASQVKSWGGKVTRFPIIKDDYELICQKVLEAARDHDLILLNAGSSAGSEDFSARVVQALGEILVHGVAVRPGHPVILGMVDVVDDGKSQGRRVPIIGVPGYPVSAALTAEIFIEPLLAHWLGRHPSKPVEIPARLSRKVTSPAGDDDYLRVAVGRVGEQMLATPLSRGSGVISSLVRADGIVILPRGSQGLPAGAPVTVRLYTPAAELERTIFASGSHDLTLDLIAQFLSSHERRLTSANLGSVGGMMAIKRGEAHIAGSHLLDPESGVYNLTFLSRYLPGIAVKVIALVEREQGLLVPKGNPKSIQSLEDLQREDVHYVNRQRGSGTRTLLDYHLGRLGIEIKSIKGYQREEFTHLAVAAAVSSKRADCGLGIAAAATALDLDFIPLFHENYELIIPEIYYHSILLAPLLDVLVDNNFKQAVTALRGYNISRMGSITAEVS